MAKNITEKYSQISIQAISQIRGQEDFVEFLRTELEWPIPLHIDRLEDVSIPHDLQRDFGFSQAEDRIQVSRLLNLSEQQPWGIFLFEFKTRRPYLSHLRRLLRVLSSRRTLQQGDPIWDRNDLLFICTQDWQEYQFVHFSGERPESAVISSFGWKGPDDRFLHTLCKHNLPRLHMPELDLDGNYPMDAWRIQWREAFNIKPVTDEFYTTLKEVFQAVESGISGLQGEHRRAFTELLINRLIFLKFVEKKGWLNDDHDYLYRQFKQYGGQRFWKDFLFHFFFEGLNTEPVQRSEDAKRVLGAIPYLNAELFALSEQWDDRQVDVEGRSLDLLFDKLLNPYNFTVAETSPLEVEVAFNQDLLGYAYEELIADQHGQGAYYTHPTEVNLMCRESLRAYLEERCPQVEKEAIARLVYGEISQTSVSPAIPMEHAVALYSVLHDVTICDPAIGSGTFPVAMVKHLFACLRSLGQLLKNYAPFRELIDQASLTDWRKGYELKLHIIERSIYGCDIDYFAVQIAKLRFWIELMVECDQAVPLPNFDFKLVVGDALISAVGSDSDGKLISLEEMWGHPTKPRGQVNLSADLVRKFAEKKKDYYGVQDPKERKHLREALFQNREQLIQQALQFSRPARQRTDQNVLWQIDFSDIFQGEKPGFDIIIANPPYLRHELIDKEYKDFLYSIYSKLNNIDLNKKNDLYIYFFLRSFQLLKRSGIICFICANSWLDVEYGVGLQEFLLKNASMTLILDNQIIRSFASADVNTAIHLFKNSISLDLSQTVFFVSLKKPYGETSIPQLLQSNPPINDLVETPDYRLFSVSQKTLLLEGSKDTKKYTGDKWGGKYLRAPNIYWVILKKARANLVTIRSQAKVRFGLKSGANEFFYLDKENIKQWEIEDIYLKPVLFSLKEIRCIEDLVLEPRFKMFFCHDSLERLKGTKAFSYILWGQENSFHLRPSCASRSLWYSIGRDWEPAPLIFPAKVGERFLVINNKHRLIEDKKLYGIVPKSGSDSLWAAVLNSTLTRFFMELSSRQLTGAQAIADVDVAVVEEILIPSLNLLPKLDIEIAYQNIAHRPIESHVEDEYRRKDRLDFDEIICKSLGLTSGEQEAIYDSIINIVKSRLQKAESTQEPD